LLMPESEMLAPAMTCPSVPLVAAPVPAPGGDRNRQ
jgi:hypothetical protein